MSEHDIASGGPGPTARCTCGEKFRGETRTAALIALVDHIDSASLVGSTPEGQTP